MNKTRQNPDGHRLVAVLGPTNTGKTHLAVDRMLGHKSGIIGLPLRLLAREIYDRIVAARGPRQVALITGEERIMPPRPNYFVCTVEAMPNDQPVDFVAIDEVQLAADFSRGHVFTSRLLHARGGRETMFLGAETMRGVLTKLFPELEIISRPRFSELSYVGQKKITRLPRRSAIVAFSSSEVYALAELIRRQRGGAAVVMGALSPRTRNAQVALYQSGEVDYLVATDAIGMGLNMNVDHVAFAALRKYDGVQNRNLTAAEIGQIAGRAGRYMNNGTFGVTGSAPAPDGELVEKVENHRFNPVERLQWRNGRLDFSSLHGLQHSLRRPAGADKLVLSRDTDDLTALGVLVLDPEIGERARTPAAIQRLWQVCQVPDFRQTMADSHHQLLRQIYLHLTGPSGHIGEDWLAPQVERLDRTDGDIDALSARIAHVRTWTFVANRAGWLADPEMWQGRTRELEDKLSDALHAALTQRFVDRRTAALYRSLKSKRDLFGAVTAAGDVLVEGQFVGKLQGLTFRPDAAANLADSRAIRAAANRILLRELDKIAAQLVDGAVEEISWRGDNCLWWRGARVARLGPGPSLLKPRLDLLETDHLSGTWRERVRQHLARWLQDRIDEAMRPLGKLTSLKGSAPGRGLVFQLSENLGSIDRAAVADLLAGLPRPEKKALKRAGLTFGYVDLFLPALLRPERSRIKALLWSARQQPEQPLQAPPAGLVSAPADRGVPDAFYAVCGYRRFADRIVRMDMLERLAAMAHKASKDGPFEPDHAMLSLAGSSAAELDPILRGLGYRGRPVGERMSYRFTGKSQTAAANTQAQRRQARASGPFASLAPLAGGKKWRR